MHVLLLRTLQERIQRDATKVASRVAGVTCEGSCWHWDLHKANLVEPRYQHRIPESNSLPVYTSQLYTWNTIMQIETQVQAHRLYIQNGENNEKKRI